MKLPQGIRTKLLAIMFVVSGMTLVTAAFGVLMMRRLADTSDAVLARYLPISRCAEQALLAVTQCAECMHEARLIDDPADADRLRIVEGKLRHSIIRFEMHTKAMMWGSESEVFARSWGGLMKTLWQREGWDRVMVVQRAPHQAQQAAGEADIYFAGFDKYAREALRSQKRMLRLQLKGQNDEARAEQLLQQGHLRRAERFASLVNLTLERSIKGLHQQIETVQDEVEVTQRFAARAMIAFAAIAFLLSLVSGSLFASAAITRPIRRLHRGTDIVGAGNLDHKVGTAARDEIGQLARAFDRMTDNLKAARSDLERQVARRQAAEEATARQKNVLAGINEVFERALTCTVRCGGQGKTCLAVAERLTGSRLRVHRRVERRRPVRHDLAEQFRLGRLPIPEAESGDADSRHGGSRNLGGSAAAKRIAHRQPSRHRSFRVGIPEGHPPLTSFLGVPLRYGTETMGMIALGNKPAGYDTLRPGCARKRCRRRSWKHCCAPGPR